MAGLVVAAVWVVWTVVPVTWEFAWRWLAIAVLSSVFLLEALFVAWMLWGAQVYVDSELTLENCGKEAEAAIWKFWPTSRTGTQDLR